MINISKYFKINEALKCPSKITKRKDASRKERVTFIAGDVYDFGDWNRYEDDFVYGGTNYVGYIYDKEGNKYDVTASTSSEDAGRIAGGAMNYNVSIKNVDGKNINFHGHSAIFSHSSYTDIIDDIENGMYLEDYIAKNWGALNNDVRNDAKLIELRDKGDKNAKTYKTQKAENAEAKKQQFNERYLPIYFPVMCNIKNGELNVNSWVSMRNIRDKFSDEQIQSQVNNAYEKTFKPIVQKLLNDKFNATMDELNGLRFSLVGDKRLCIDLKKGDLCIINSMKDVQKLSNITNEISFGPTMELIKSNASPKMFELFKTASEAYLKLNKRKKTQFIQQNFDAMLMQVRGSEWYPSPYQPQSSYKKQMAACKKEAKERTAEEFYKDLNLHDITKNATSIEFLTEFISQYITKPEKLEQTIDEPVDNNEGGAKTVSKQQISAKARGKQEEKMDAWHNGTRKQNVKSCSDAKLKINYDICVDKGYTHEAELLKKEAQSRGLTFESVSWKISDYIEFM